MSTVFRVRITDIEQVMRPLGALGGGRFGGADVEAAIDLHRVVIDDLAVERLCETEGELGFSAACGAGNDRERHTLGTRVVPECVRRSSASRTPRRCVRQ